MDSVKDAGFCHDAELDGVNLLWTCVESCDTFKHAHTHAQTALETTTVGLNRKSVSVVCS